MIDCVRSEKRERETERERDVRKKKKSDWTICNRSLLLSLSLFYPHSYQRSSTRLVDILGRAPPVSVFDAVRTDSMRIDRAELEIQLLKRERNCRHLRLRRRRLSLSVN